MILNLAILRFVFPNKSKCQENETYGRKFYQGINLAWRQTGMENLPREIIENQQMQRINHLLSEIQHFYSKIDKTINNGR